VGVASRRGVGNHHDSLVVVVKGVRGVQGRREQVGGGGGMWYVGAAAARIAIGPRWRRLTTWCRCKPAIGGKNFVLKRSGDRGWGTTVKWFSGLSLCVCVRTCFFGCPKVRPPLSTESTSQIVPTGPSAPSSRAHTDAHALAPNRITHQIKKPLEQCEDQIQNTPKVTPQDDPTRMYAT